jgi:hypothetical protein
MDLRMYATRIGEAMPEDQDLDDLEDESPAPVTQISVKDLKALRASARKADEAQAQLAELGKRTTFLEAGVDLESPVGRLLFTGYQGELDHESIRKAAEEVGALKAATPPPPPDPGIDTSQTDERREMANGAPADEFRQADPDPKVVALEAGKAALENGASEESALGLMFEKIARAAEKGDERALWNPGG